MLSGAVVFPQVQVMEAEQVRLERERPAAAPRPVVTSADACPALDLDRRRAVVDTLVEAVVGAKAAQRCAPDRLAVVWRA